MPCVDQFLGEALPHDRQPSVSQTDVVIFLNDHPVAINGELEERPSPRDLSRLRAVASNGFRGLVGADATAMGQLGNGWLLGHGMATRGYERGFGHDFLFPLVADAVSE